VKRRGLRRSGAAEGVTTTCPVR